MLIGTGEMIDVWRFNISNEYHNHKSSKYHHGYSKVSRLIYAQYERVKKLCKVHVKSKQILNLMIKEDPYNKTSL